MQQTCHANRWCESEKRKTLNKKFKVNWIASISFGNVWLFAINVVFHDFFYWLASWHMHLSGCLIWKKKKTCQLQKIYSFGSRSYWLVLTQLRQVVHPAWTRTVQLVIFIPARSTRSMRLVPRSQRESGKHPRCIFIEIIQASHNLSAFKEIGREHSRRDK